MRMQRGLLQWGLFLILLGAIPLAVSQGLLDAGTAGRAWTLWPILLIAAGLGILLRATPIAGLTGLVGAAVVGIIGGGLIAGGGIPVGGCGDDRGTTAFPTAQGTLGESAVVEIRFNCGDLTVEGGPGSDWRVEGRDAEGRWPQVEQSDSRLRLESPGGRGIDFLDTRAVWQVLLPSRSDLDLRVGVNAGTARIELPGMVLNRVSIELNAGQVTAPLADAARLSEVSLQVNAGSGRLTLPNQSLTGRLQVNAGEILVCAPAGAGLRFIGDDSIVASYELPGLTRTGNAWESPDYASATTRIELRVEANAGRLALNPGGGCGE